MNTTRELAERVITAMGLPLEQEQTDAAERAIRQYYSERLRAGREAKRSRGGRVEGQIRYGKDAHEKHIITLMQTFRNHGHSLDSIAHTLNSTGILSRHGRQWHGKTVANILKRMDASVEPSPMA